MLVAKRFLAIDQDDILTAPGQFPVLKPVVEQERVAAEVFNGVTAALDAVFIHHHHHVLEVGGEHVGSSRRFRIEQERFSRPKPNGAGAVSPEKQFVQKHLADGSGLDRQPRERMATVPPVLQFARKFFDDWVFRSLRW